MEGVRKKFGVVSSEFGEKNSIEKGFYSEFRTICRRPSGSSLFRTLN